MQPDIQWFIARDGQQHGPLSSAEMRVFVEQGYLRPNDLIWRQGFPDWRPAASVFPGQQRSPVSSEPRSSVAALTQYFGNGQPGTTPQGAYGFSAGAMAQPPSSRDEPEGGAPNETGRPTSRRWRVAALATGALLIASGSLAVYMRDDVRLFLASSTESVIPTIKAPVTADVSRPPSADTATSPSTNVATGTSGNGTPPEFPTSRAELAAIRPERAGPDIDERLQKAELWRFLKQEYSDWYQDVLTETGKLNEGAEFDRNLSEVLVKRVVELRRKHASDALAASAGTLTGLADVFLANLKEMAGRGAEPCYTFISKGEASPPVKEIMTTPAQSVAMHAQLLAIFKAAIEGRASPAKHPAPRKEDYEALTAQLNKMGWKKDDIQLFADPKALSKAPPDRVCQMVQDWFTAHLNLKGPGTKERLLFETLRPVVSG